MLEKLTQTMSELVDGRDAVGFDLAIDLGATGRIHLAGKAAPMQVSNGAQSADTTLVITPENLQALIAGTLNPMQAYMGGQLKVQGDLGRALELAALFS